MNDQKAPQNPVHDLNTLEGRIACASSMGKALLFPEIEKFDQLFYESVGGGYQATHNRTILKAKSGFTYAGHVEISGGEKYLYGKALIHLSAFNKIADEMLAIVHDECSVKIVKRDDGFSLITMQYNMIIGSRWLAFIPVSALPAWMR